MNAEQEVPRETGSLRDGIFLGGGSTWRKELVNVTAATSTFPIKRLGELRPLLLLEFHPDTPADTVDWLLGRILAAESLGGADLLGRVIGVTRARGPMVVVGAPPERLLLEADEDLLFRHKPFCSLLGEEPRGAGPTAGLCGMLSSAECVTLLQRILGKLRVGDWEEVRVFPSMRLLPGEAVMTTLARSKVLTDCYPLHDAALLQSLKAHWTYRCWGLWPQTHAQHRLLLEEIRAYFGESLAAYVSFEGELVGSLLLKAILSLLLWFYPLQVGCGLLFYSLSSVLWSEMFLQGWRRRSEAREKDWSTVMTHVPHSQSPSPSPSPSPGPAGTPVVADPGPAPVRQRQDSLLGEVSWTRLLHSLSFLSCVLLLSCALLLNYLHFGGLLKEVLVRQDDAVAPSLRHVLFYLPEVALTLAMAGVDCLALWLSRSLSPRPGPGGRPSPFPPPPPPAERHYLLLELILSCLFNHFAVHFYRALALQDFDALRRHLAAQLATRLSLKLLAASLPPCPAWATRAPAPGRPNQDRQPPVLRQIQEQSSRPECGSQTRSYLELLLSYCHVMFFSGVYPQCAVWCLLLAAAQSRLDVRRLCVAQRRPFPQATWEGVGVWEQVFGGLEVLAVLLNSTLLWVSPEFRTLFHSYSQGKVLRAFLLLQFILLALRAALSALLHSLARAFSRQAEQINPRHPRHHWLHRQQSQTHPQPQGAPTT
ncbi:anoctamin-10-like [Osmerus mordax]|uniref:anoctamin-10-like n=1 Tax=Osmerus mordax TaxID=8014 RepID=UPI00350F8E39